MAFDDAQIDMDVVVEREPRPGFHFPVVPKDELKLLLVDGRGCQQGCLDTELEPGGSCVAVVAHLPHCLDFMIHPLGLAISDGDVGLDDLSLAQHVGAGLIDIDQVCFNGTAGIFPHRSSISTLPN